MTILGRGSGATLVTALTASPKAKGLFQRVWATNGAGVYEDTSLQKANLDNKVRQKQFEIIESNHDAFIPLQVILNNLKCGADEMTCLKSVTGEDLAAAAPSDW